MGSAGTEPVAWMVSWYFVRQHPLFAGLPTDCVMDWRYQVAVQGADGLKIDAPNMEVVAGYGRDHCPEIGVGTCVIPHGKGKIVLLSLPNLVTALTENNRSIHPTVAKHLLNNALVIK